MDEALGAWTPWLADTQAESAPFNGEDGRAYAFRARAVDQAGWVEPWPEQADTRTTVDLSIPSSAVQDLAPYQTRAEFVVGWQATDGSADLAGFDIQAREAPSSDWVAWLTATQAFSGTFAGAGDKQYAFRSRAIDRAGHVEAWPDAPDAETLVDLAAPASSVSLLPEIQTSPTFTVCWLGQDAGSGVASYEIQFADQATGAWQDWITGTHETQASFTGQDGHQYAFRSRASDRAGHWENWPDAADAATLIDAALPSSFVEALAPYQTESEFIVRWQARKGALDIGGIDIFVRASDQGGWMSWLEAATGTEAAFVGEEGRTYLFQSRARDLAGRVEPWPAAPDAQTMLDFTPPWSRVSSLPATRTTLTFTVQWSGGDNASGVSHYDIQVRDAAEPGWAGWLTATQLTTASFTGQDGRAYQFRSRAVDKAGHVEDWPATADAQTTINTGLPRSAVSPLADYQTSAEFIVRWSGQSTRYALAGYDIQVRDVAGGEWAAWLTRTLSTEGAFTGQDGRAYQFRSRAIDKAGRVEGWPDAPDAQTTLDLTPPASMVGAMPAFQPAVTFTVNWSGSDATSGISHYYIHALDQAAPEWTSWQNATTEVSATFIGENQHTYVFESQAWDVAGNAQPRAACAPVSTTVLLPPSLSSVEESRPNPKEAVVRLSVFGVIDPWMTFEWDFGDGGRARSAAGDISHRYASGGQYAVVVTAANPTGAAVARRTVVISADQAAWRPRRLIPIVIRGSR
jgi:hypothetical protein